MGWRGGGGGGDEVRVRWGWGWGEGEGGAEGEDEGEGEGEGEGEDYGGAKDYGGAEDYNEGTVKVRWRGQQGLWCGEGDVQATARVIVLTVTLSADDELNEWQARLVFSGAHCSEHACSCIASCCHTTGFHKSMSHPHAAQNCNIFQTNPQKRVWGNIARRGCFKAIHSTGLSDRAAREPVYTRSSLLPWDPRPPEHTSMASTGLQHHHIEQRQTWGAFTNLALTTPPSPARTKTC